MNVENSVTLIGHLGQDVEFKDLGSGRQLAKVSLATNEKYKNKEGELVSTTSWHNIIMWGKKASSLASIVKKGSHVAISGKIEYNSYEDQEGNKRRSTVINAASFKKLDKKNSMTDMAMEPAF